jgi:hypothetical protein
VYIYVLKDERKKLDLKTFKFVFLGYNSNTKGLNYYYLGTHIIIITQGVKFDESNLSSFKYFPTPNIDPFASIFYFNNFDLELSNSFVKLMKCLLLTHNKAMKLL